MTDTVTKTETFHIKARIEDLIPLITQGGQQASSQQAHPVYECVKLTTCADAPKVLRCESTDLEVAHIVERGFDDIEILGNGSLCVSKKELLLLLRSTKKGQCELRAVIHDGEASRDIVLEMDGGEFTIQGCFVADFPELPQVTEELTDAAIMVPLDQFFQGVRRTEFSAARERMRYALNGILVTVEGRSGPPKGKSKKREELDPQALFVSTDGRRLSVVEVGHELTVSGDVKGIIPTLAMTNAMKWIPKKKGQPDLLSGLEAVRLAFGNNHVSISFGDFEIVSRLVEGSFPSYKDVIPQDRPVKLLFDKGELQKALYQASLCSSREALAVRMDIDTGTRRVKVSSRSAEKSFKREVKAHIEGEDAAIAFNPGFLLDALDVHDGGSVQLEAAGTASPCVMVYESWTHVVMPVSLE